MNSLDWKPISQDPPVKHGWFAVAVLPLDHDELTLEQINLWRERYGCQEAWFIAESVDKWYRVSEPRSAVACKHLITHWTELPQVPTLTEKPA